MKISHRSSAVFSSEAVWKYTIEQESAEAQRTKTTDPASCVSAVPTGLWQSPTSFPALKCRAIFTASRWDARTGMGRRFPAPRQGQHENSPALQCRGSSRFLRSPVGTAETSGVSAVPTGLSSSVSPFLLFNPAFSRQVPFPFSNGLSAFSQTPSAARMN
jgi:hypothetical protein